MLKKNKKLLISFSGPPPAMTAGRLTHTGPSWADRVKCNHSVAKSSQPLAAPVDKLGKRLLASTTHNPPFPVVTRHLVFPSQVKRTPRAGRPCRGDAPPNLAPPQS